ATETITGGETRTVTGGLTETVNGGVTLTVNGNSIRLLSGSDLRITCSGRIETVTAMDIKQVNGTDCTTVTGPKIVVAPLITYHTTQHIDTTSTYTIDATVSITRSPHTILNVSDETWLKCNFLRWSNQTVRALVLATDFYGMKLQACAINTQINGWFTNRATTFLLDAPIKFETSARSSKKKGLNIGVCKLHLSCVYMTKKK
ncbi:hypothetical protein M2282_001593, partial [Variovorax boronicumulans]|nr:hypothetical protein [Variovorax boronicumulans]